MHNGQPKPEVKRRGMGRRSPATRERILAEAARLFAEKGYHATGVAELSSAVGLGAGALYHHIGSKEEVLVAICRPHILQVLEVGERLLTAETGTKDKLRLLAREHMRMVAERTVELRVTLREINSFTGPRREEMQQLRDRTEAVWEQITEQGRRSGELAALDPLFVKAALGALNYAVLWYHPTGPLTPDEVADRIMDMMLSGGVDQSPEKRAGRFSTKARTPSA
jgi:TetR/AcrR family transcriptional regulator, cholesterol catabolism regulator